MEDIPIKQVAVGDAILVRAGEVIPVDGVITSANAMIDESALTGEPIPVDRRAGEPARSGTINVGETFELRATATAGESTHAGIVRMVTAAQTAKAPFIRLADRYALLLLPITLLVAAAAWLLSADPIRGLAVFVAATPRPLILAAPAAFIAGISQAARRGILIKGGGPLEAPARTHTVMFDKTGTLTVGGARLVAIETAPGENADEVLRLAGSREQASHHVVATAIGALAGFFGIGGGFLIVPGLMLATGMALPSAIGTSLVAITAFGLAWVPALMWHRRARTSFCLATISLAWSKLSLLPGDADGGFGKCGRIVDAVANHSNHALLRHQLPNARQLLFRKEFRLDLGNPKFGADSSCDTARVSTVFRPIRCNASMAGWASGRMVSATMIEPSSCPLRATNTSAPASASWLHVAAAATPLFVIQIWLPITMMSQSSFAVIPRPSV